MAHWSFRWVPQKPCVKSFHSSLLLIDFDRSFWELHGWWKIFIWYAMIYDIISYHIHVFAFHRHLPILHQCSWLFLVIHVILMHNFPYHCSFFLIESTMFARSTLCSLFVCFCFFNKFNEGFYCSRFWGLGDTLRKFPGCRPCWQHQPQRWASGGETCQARINKPWLING